MQIFVIGGTSFIGPHVVRHHLFASSKRIRDELGYCEPVSFDEAVKRTVAWQLENMG